jgi:hypothetical protein
MVMTCPPVLCRSGGNRDVKLSKSATTVSRLGIGGNERQHGEQPPARVCVQQSQGDGKHWKGGEVDVGRLAVEDGLQRLLGVGEREDGCLDEDLLMAPDEVASSAARVVL